MKKVIIFFTLCLALIWSAKGNCQNVTNQSGWTYLCKVEVDVYENELLGGEYISSQQIELYYKVIGNTTIYAVKNDNPYIGNPYQAKTKENPNHEKGLFLLVTKRDSEKDYYIPAKYVYVVPCEKGWLRYCFNINL